MQPFNYQTQNEPTIEYNFDNRIFLNLIKNIIEQYLTPSHTSVQHSKYKCNTNCHKVLKFTMLVLQCYSHVWIHSIQLFLGQITITK